MNLHSSDPARAVLVAPIASQAQKNVSPITPPVTPSDRTAKNKRLGNALASQLLNGLEAWARQVQLLCDDDTSRATPGYCIDALTKAFTDTPQEGWFTGGSPLARDGAAYTFARVLFPDVMPDADEAEADSLDGFAQTAFMLAHAALVTGLASRQRVWLSDGALYLLQSAAVVATRMVEEGRTLQAEVEKVEGGPRDG